MNEYNIFLIKIYNYFKQLKDLVRGKRKIRNSDLAVFVVKYLSNICFNFELFKSEIFGENMLKF